MKLVKYEAARLALYEANSVDEVKDIRDKAEAMRAYAKQARDFEMANWAAEIRIRAERKLGQMLITQKEGGLMAQGKRTDLVAPCDQVDNKVLLNDMGISKSMSSRAQAIAKVPDKEFEEVISDHREQQEELTSATIYKLTKSNILHSSNSNEWYTPEKYIQAARQVMGSIDLDPASNDIANKKIMANMIWTIEDDGLNKDWIGNVWLNPPYGYTNNDSNQSLWTEKLINSYIEGKVTQAVLLINATPSNKWFNPLWDYLVCFTNHRICFYNENIKNSQPTHSNAFVYFGNKKAEFIQEFTQFGTVVERAKYA